MKRVTLSKLQKMKRNGERFVVLTAYDAAFAKLIDAAGVEVILVGDSLGMVVQGHESTVAVTLEQMVYHTAMVSRGASQALIIADMPFLSYSSNAQAISTAAALMREGGAQMVKLEGGGVVIERVTALADAGVPVCAHLGLTPQSVYKIGGYRVQGRDPRSAQAIVADAAALAAAGADLLVLECVPAPLATAITEQLSIPVIGIGAGGGCDAQVLVLHDILGLTPGTPPSFSHNFLAANGSIAAALSAYAAAVRDGSFPGAEHTFY
ncbi:MAG: 3-methyl-2-oxobutanoate hydroxymethyltransferase [Gammaproteobacteria bacterium]|nr:3-methyl-2-oxobutanoate hydroxymethyltransferase [Gammaproteobacteria bacterium]